MEFPAEINPQVFTHSWQAFEALAAVIYRRQINIGLDDIRLNQKLVGEQGLTYQCDAVIEISENERLIIEVKSGAQIIERRDMDAFVEKIRCLGEGTRGVYIVENRFRSGAIVQARYRNIEIYILTESRSEHWAERVETIIVNFNIIQPRIQNFNISARARTLEERGTTRRDHVDARNTYLTFSGVQQSLSDFVHSQLSEAPEGHNTLEFAEDEAYIEYPSGEIYELRDISFDKVVLTTQEPIRIERSPYENYCVLQNPENITDCIIFPKDELFQEIIKLRSRN